MIYHKSVLADLLTPVSAYLKVTASAHSAFLLESVEGGEKIGRYSFIGVSPYRTFEGTFAEFRRQFPAVQSADPELPPFTGGAVGVFAYEMVRELERLPDRHASAGPSVLMDYYSSVLAFDHLQHRIVILSHESMERVEELERMLLEGPVGMALPSPDSSPELHLSAPDGNGHTYRQAVETAKEYIRAGDIFQVVLSQRFTVDFSGDPFNVYRALRYLNPSPYLFYLKRGDVYVAGSSPEMLLRVQGREIEYRPIAGTRPRGRTPEEEKKLEQELFADEKERAEHVMLVDLGRNDVGRVSEYGSVCVENFMFLEKYSHVMHLVSALRSRLRPDLDRFDALAACFPAGTVTGAPKVRAMEIIDELEPSARGFYAGAIGYLDFCGNLDTCIAIRTIVMKGGQAILQAGAGIVADSVPNLEDQECRNKARVLFRALELSHRFASPEPATEPQVKRVVRNARIEGTIMRVLLIDNYDSFTYNLAQYLGELDCELHVVRNDRISPEEAASLRPDRIVISPGPGTPEQAGVSMEMITRFSGSIPILGVCLGHQAIGAAFGASVVRAPELRHGKTSPIFHDGDSLFSGLPTPFQATRYHSLIVSRDGFPDSLEMTAWTDDGLIMGLKHRAFSVFGVQFHPESVLTPQGRKILENFLCCRS